MLLPALKQVNFHKLAPQGYSRLGITNLEIDKVTFFLLYFANFAATIFGYF